MLQLNPIRYHQLYIFRTIFVSTKIRYCRIGNSGSLCDAMVKQRGYCKADINKDIP